MLVLAIAAAAATAAAASAPGLAWAGVLPPSRTPSLVAARQAGEIEPTASVTLSPLFPTNVGFQGPMAYGAAPFNAQYNPVNASANGKMLTGESVEHNYHALNSSNSSSFKIHQNWGNNSPYFPSPLFPEWQSQRTLDPKCTIEQVQILHRHGSRSPTSDTTEGAPLFGQAIAYAKGNASAGTGPAINATGDLAFLNDWNYELGVEVLVPNGAQELFDSGVRSYYQYGKLYDPQTQTHKPVVRTTSQERMLESARYWTAGFWGLDAPNLIDLEVIIEGTGFNDTLAPYDTCNNSNLIYVGDSILLPEWRSIYLVNATERLQPQVAGLNLTTELVYGMQSLCAYETVGLGTSPFCQLFTEEEWRGFEYALDLEYWGDYAFGSQTGRAQGVGLAQDVLARLTNQTIPLEQVTTQNMSLLNSTYFPLDQKLYVDFTHDDVLQSVLAVFNYTQVIDSVLDPKHNNEGRVYKMSNITPFAARLIYEVATCDTVDGKNETIIRTLLNDALIPFTEAQGCTPRADGACLLDEFVQYQEEHLLPAANFDFACFGNYTPAVVSNGTVWG